MTVGARLGGFLHSVRNYINTVWWCQVQMLFRAKKIACSPAPYPHRNASQRLLFMVYSSKNRPCSGGRCRDGWI